MSSVPTDGSESAGDPVVTLVMPAYNAAELIAVTLAAAQDAAGADNVLIVDPGSDDGTAEVAEERGGRVIRMGRRAGPAEARNFGVGRIDGDVVLFVDSDCRAHPDAVERVRRAFAADPELVSLTGSYDIDPPDPGFFSQYMNLRHHYTHQKALRENATFWAGCGAVRLDVFRACGGFDAKAFPRPMIEDIELGVRLKSYGNTRLDPDLQVTHLKRWTLRSVVSTDIFQRAIPWSRLILESGLPDDLNLRSSQRLAALLAPLALLSLPAIPLLLALLDPIWVLLPSCLVLASMLLNLGLFACFARRRGLPFAIGGWLFHQVHLFYSAVTFVLVALHVKLFSRRGSSGK